MYDETQAQKENTTIRNTQFPSEALQWILSGPHFFVGIPFYKTPRKVSRLSSDYDVLDLAGLPDSYLPRSNYLPACDLDEYLQRIPHVFWSEPSEIGPMLPKRVTEYYRFVNREMIVPNS